MTLHLKFERDQVSGVWDVHPHSIGLGDCEDCDSMLEHA